VIVTPEGLRARLAAGTSATAIAAEALARIAEFDDPALFLHLRPEAEIMAEAEGVASAPDITALGGWRAHLAARG